MTTALDTNVLIALWGEEHEFNADARQALNAALGRGSLAISAPVYAELLAGPGRDEAFLDRFLSDTGITVEWELGEAVWRKAGQAFHNYAARRRKQGHWGPRRILVDFLIGAHALSKGYRLLTFDAGLYRRTFPSLILAC